MASAMHHIFPVTVETLYMVARHVRDSFHDKPSCKATEIPLQFVFGPEQSLAKFTEVSLSIFLSVILFQSYRTSYITSYLLPHDPF